MARNTHSQVLGALARHDSFVTAQEVHATLIQHGERLGLATVYRHLRLMAEAHTLDVQNSPDGQTRYRSCAPTHHHHLTCRLCGITREIEAPDVEEWVTALATREAFHDAHHVLEITGVCDACHTSR